MAAALTVWLWAVLPPDSPPSPPLSLLFSAAGLMMVLAVAGLLALVV